MNKFLGATILVFSGASLLAQAASFGRELRPILIATPPMKLSPVHTTAIATPVAIPVPVMTVLPVAGLILRPTASPIAPMISPVRTPVVTGPTVSPSPTSGPVPFPTTPLPYPTTPLSPP